MEGACDILRSLDARNSTGATEASVRLEDQRESPEPGGCVAGLVLGGYN